MKRILTFAMALLMILAVLASCQGQTHQTSSEPGGSSVSISSGDAPSGDVSSDVSSDSSEQPDIFNTIGVNSTEKKEHKYLEELPSSATLIGDKTLPAIDNQGGVGSCASQAIAHMQFTNAVAKYAESLGKLTWNPSESYDDCFSPKYTYQFAGASTANVYRFLMEHGALTNKVDKFFKSTDGGSQKHGTETLRWIVDEQSSLDALSYRLTGYEQTFVTNNADYTAPGKTGVAMTTSEAGKAMINKIKDAIATGNVVVTGGYPSSWVMTKLNQNQPEGSIAKKNDSVIVAATNDYNGGHQVCIVAYDDNVTIKANGVLMKGAFLIANSWGEGWGTNGYSWIMYDALNEQSESDDFQFTGTNAGKTRGWPLDQFCFTYWDSDVTIEKPELYAQFSLSTIDRNNFSFEITRTDKNGHTVSVVPRMFEYAGLRDDYDLKGYLNTDGIENGPETTGYYAVNFERLFENMPAGSTYENYTWSVKINALNDSSVKVNSVKLFSGDTELASTVVDDVLTGSRNYYFTFDNEQVADLYDGAYTLKNVATGEYLVKESVMTFKPGNEKSALTFNIKCNAESGRYQFWRNDNEYVISAITSKGLSDGLAVRFNKDHPDKTESQIWDISYNEDGTVYIYLTDANGVKYALGLVDGKVVLVKVKEAEDCIKWILTPASITTAYTAVSFADGKLTVSGLLKSSVKDTSLNIKVTPTSGTTTEVSATVSDRTFTAVVLEGAVTENHIISIENSKGEKVGGWVLYISKK